MDQSISAAVNRALASNEAAAEYLANRIRLMFLCAITALAVFNAFEVSAQSNLSNFGAIGVALLYGGALPVYLRRRGYRPALKYVTSFVDITAVHVVLLLYTLNSEASVALKNPAFYIVYPLIALTLFRCHPRLTLLTGVYTVVLYSGLFMLVASQKPLLWGDYTKELFGADVTVIGQATKLLILVAFVLVVFLLARYGRMSLHKLVSEEVIARSSKEAMERELELASQVQAHLLPGSYPKVEGLTLCGTIIEGRYVGGDYYDFIQTSPHSVLVLIGDVSGKGVPAALIMAAARAAARLSASMKMNLEQLVLRLNETLYESSPSDRYLTLFAAEINARAGTLRYINAGHPPALLYAPGCVRQLTEGTAPLGLFPALPNIRAYSEPFTPGSLLVACTDGVSERSDLAGEFYGLGSLRDFVERNYELGPGEFVGSLLDEVRRFGANLPLEDDLTLAVARSEA